MSSDREILDSDLPEIPEAVGADDLEIVLTGEDAPDWMGTQDPGSPAELLRQTRERPEAEDEPKAQAEPDELKPEVLERIEAANRRAEAAERLAAQREEYFEVQMLNMEKAKVATQRDSIKTALDGLDLRLNQAEAALAAAEEASDFAEKNRISRILRDLEKARDAYSDAQHKLPSDAALDHQFHEYRRTKPKAATSSERASGDGVEPLTEAARKWASHNSWYKDPKYAGEAAYMMHVSNTLANEGLDPKSQAYMDELTKRVHRRFPDIPVKTSDGRAMGVAPQARRSSAPPVASARSSVAPSSGKNGKIRAEITASDRAMMRSMGLDPANPEIQRRFAREKIMTRMNERRS
jgi:hypothetical protein